MRKSLLAVITLVCLAVATGAPAVFAQELGGPVTLTPKGQFSLSASVSYVFEQKTKDYDLNRNYSDGYREIGKKSGKIKDDQYYLLGLSYGLADWLNVFAQAGVVGGGKFQDYDRQTGSNWEATMDSQFVWAVGAKAQAFKLDNGLALGLVARYLRYDNRKLKDYADTVDGYQADNDWSVDEKMDYWQVDLSAVVSRSWGPVTPYVGVGYAYSEAKESGRWTDKTDASYYIDYESTVKNDQPIMALCGLDVALGQGFSLYLNGVFFARTAVGAGLTWSF